MGHADILIHNIGQLVTCTSPGGPKRGTAMSDVGIIANGAVAVVDGKIAAVGLNDEILSQFDEANTIDAGGNVVCPGFVDPHTHIVFAGNRLDEFELKIKGAEYLEILAAGGGIISTVRNTRKASEDELVDGALRRLDKMLRCGTTACEIKTGYGLDTKTELKMLRVIAELARTHPITIVPTFLPAHAVPPEFKDRAGDYVELVCTEMLPAAWEWYQASEFSLEKIPLFIDVFTERNAFDLTQTRKVLETARSLGFQIKAHVDQFTNLGGSGLGVEMGAASIDHLDAISDEEIRRLAASETVGVVIPTENFNAGKSQFAPARRMIDAGCAIALTTDYNPGSAPCPSMPMSMAIACRYQKLLPAEAVNAGTINAAHAIGLGETVGSIEVGKLADLSILDLRDYRSVVNEFGYVPLLGLIKEGVFREV
jgi:imidazolonepropionase